MIFQLATSNRFTVSITVEIACEIMHHFSDFKVVIIISISITISISIIIIIIITIISFIIIIIISKQWHRAS